MKYETQVAGPKGTGHREHAEQALAAAGIYQMPVGLDVGTIGALKLAIQSGAGIGFLPEPTVQVELAAGVLKAVELRGLPTIRVRFALITRAKRGLSPLVAEVKRFIRTELDDMSDDGTPT